MFIRPNGINAIVIGFIQSDGERMNEDIAVIVVFYLSMAFIILMIDEIKSEHKIIGIGLTWILLGITLAILYPDEFSDFMLG